MTQVIVSVDRSRFDEVAVAVEAAGLQNMHRMPILSKLSGDVSDENRQALEAVDGVRRVVVDDSENRIPEDWD